MTKTRASRSIVRAERLLPAWLAGQLPARQAHWLEARLAADADLAATRDRLVELARVLHAHDPASPVAADGWRSLRAELHAELERGRVAAPALGRLRPAYAGLAALLLFGLGLVTGAKLFPTVETREVVREQRVTVTVPVVKPMPVEVEVPVRVEVPVEKVVTRWRTRTVVETKVVYRTRSGVDVPPAAAVAREPRPSVPVVTIDPAEITRAGVGIAALPEAARPEAVDF